MPGPNPLNPTGSNASPYAGETVSAESFTSIEMPLELHGRSFGTYKVEIVVAHHECATLRVGDLFLKIERTRRLRVPLCHIARAV